MVKQCKNMSIIYQQKVPFSSSPVMTPHKAALVSCPPGNTGNTVASTPAETRWEKVVRFNIFFGILTFEFVLSREECRVVLSQLEFCLYLKQLYDIIW